MNFRQVKKHLKSPLSGFVRSLPEVPKFYWSESLGFQFFILGFTFLTKIKIFLWWKNILKYLHSLLIKIWSFVRSSFKLFSLPKQWSRRLEVWEKRRNFKIINQQKDCSAAREDGDFDSRNDYDYDDLEIWNHFIIKFH